MVRLLKNIPILLILFALVSGVAEAQINRLPNPIELADGQVGDSVFPKIAQDMNGNLHVVWIEKANNNLDMIDAIFYSRYDGRSWSNPIDVLVSPGGEEISLGELIMLPNGELAMVWTGGGQVFFSKAHYTEANFSRSWQTIPILTDISEVSSSYLVFSPPTTFYVAVVDLLDLGIKFTTSPDLGNSWSDTVSIWSPVSRQFSAADVRMCLDPSGSILHLVWHVIAEDLDWTPYEIWYMRSKDQGKSWSEEFALQNNGSSPNCEYDGSGMLHMVWNNSVGSLEGRYHRFSLNDGVNWSNPKSILPGLSGRTRAPAFGMDSDGILHVLTGAFEGDNTKMFWSYWDGQNWTNPLVVSGDFPNNESPDLVVSEGNLLNVVWHFDVDRIPGVLFSSLKTSSTAFISSTPQEEVNEILETSTQETFVSPQDSNDAQEQDPVATRNISENAFTEEQPLRAADSIFFEADSSLPLIIGGLSGFFVVLIVLIVLIRVRR